MQSQNRHEPDIQGFLQSQHRPLHCVVGATVSFPAHGNPRVDAIKPFSHIKNWFGIDLAS
jgi:hypothetical protein